MRIEAGFQAVSSVVKKWQHSFSASSDSAQQQHTSYFKITLLNQIIIHIWIGAMEQQVEICCIYHKLFKIVYVIVVVILTINIFQSQPFAVTLISKTTWYFNGEHLYSHWWYNNIGNLVATDFIWWRLGCIDCYFEQANSISRSSSLKDWNRIHGLLLFSGSLSH